MFIAKYTLLVLWKDFSIKNCDLLSEDELSPLLLQNTLLIVNYIHCGVSWLHDGKWDFVIFQIWPTHVKLSQLPGLILDTSSSAGTVKMKKMKRLVLRMDTGSHVPLEWVLSSFSSHNCCLIQVNHLYSKVFQSIALCVVILVWYLHHSLHESLF